MKPKPVNFRDLPPAICNYFDKGPTDQRVKRAEVRKLKIAGKVTGEEFIVYTNFGKAYFRQDKWGDWKLWKCTDGLPQPTE